MTGFGSRDRPARRGEDHVRNGIQHFFSLTGRPCAVVNLDPANHNPPYECAVSIEELISLEEVQNELDLGPNGGMMYCMEYVAKNLDWLRDRVAPLVKEGKYVLFDLPGQVELFTSHDAVKQIIRELTASKTTDMDLRLCTVHLVDGHLCADPQVHRRPHVVAAPMLPRDATRQRAVQSGPDGQVRRPGLQPRVLRGRAGPALPGDRMLGENDEPEGGARRASQRKPHWRARGCCARSTESSRASCESWWRTGLVNFATLSIEDKESVTRLVRLTDKCVGT